MRHNGRLLYCRTQILTGTHFSSSVCLTEAQIRARDQDTQSTKDHLGREGGRSGGLDLLAGRACQSFIKVKRHFPLTRSGEHGINQRRLAVVVEK